MLPWSEDQGKQQVLEQLRDPVVYFKGLKGKGPTFADTHFRSAALVQQHLADRIGADRMVQVVGINRPTAIWIHGMPPGDSQSYSTSLDGDGQVARELGLLSDTRATFFVDEEHGALPGKPHPTRRHRIAAGR